MDPDHADALMGLALVVGAILYILVPVFILVRLGRIARAAEAILQRLGRPPG